jgi:hypothetical protein
VRIDVRRKNGQEWLVATERGQPAAGRASARFDELAFADAVFSDDGHHVALAARRGQRWQVLRDLEAGASFDGVGALGFDRTGRHLGYAAQERAGWRVVVDGLPGPAYAAIGEPLRFSDDGSRIGYVAVDGPDGRCVRAVIGGVAGRCWRGVAALSVGCDPARDTYVAVADDGAGRVLVRGDQPSGRFDEIGELRTAGCGAHWGATVRQGELWRVVVDGDALPTARRVAHLAFGADGRRVAYTAERDGWMAVVDGAEGSRFDEVTPPAFSPDGAHVGYIGTRGAARVMVIDGDARPAEPGAFGLVIGPDGRRHAYFAGTPLHPQVVCDDVVYPFRLLVEETMSFSNDGRHWAVLAGDPAARTLFIALDGRPGQRLDTEELFGSGVGLAAPTTVLRRWVAAEMELALAEARP